MSKFDWSIPPTEPRYEKAWRLLQNAVGPIDSKSGLGAWAVQVQNFAEQLIEMLREYGDNPTPTRWVDIDEMTSELGDLLTGTME